MNKPLTKPSLGQYVQFDDKLKSLYDRLGRAVLIPVSYTHLRVTILSRALGSSGSMGWRMCPPSTPSASMRSKLSLIHISRPNQGAHFPGVAAQADQHPKGPTHHPNPMNSG